MKIVKKIQPKIVIFTAVKNRCMLHGHVFVMSIAGNFWKAGKTSSTQSKLTRLTHSVTVDLVENTPELNSSQDAFMVQ